MAALYLNKMFLNAVLLKNEFSYVAVDM